MSETKAKISRDTKRWEIEVNGEIAPEALAEHRKHVLAHMVKDAHLPGFRPGKAPESAVIKAVGEGEILRRTIEHSVQHELPEILAKENAPIVEAPRVTVTSAPANWPAEKPVVFTARAGLAPEIKLPDYKKIAAKTNADKKEVEVTDEEHQQTLTHLKRERARITKVELGVTPQEAHAEAQKMEEKDLPALDDEFVKSLGYENLEKFSESVRTNIKNEKGLREIERRRAALLDELVAESKISYPALLKEYELDDMEARLRQDLQNMGLTWEQYLAEMKKTAEEIRTGWDEAADKRAKVRLVLSRIAQEEKIDADPERLEREIKHAKQHYPQADDAGLRAHIQHALRNEAVIAFLEQQ